MALIRCNQCGNMVSENAQACPQCGNPMNAYMQPTQNSFAGMNNANAAPKNKTTAGLLAIFLGAFGAHYFYLNKPTAGIVFLAVWLVGIFLFTIPCIILWIVCLIQGIMMLTMSEQDFQNKYVYTTNQFPFF